MPERMVKVASAQLGPAPEERAPLIARIVRLVEEAADMHVDVIGFPELSMSPYFPAGDYRTDFEKFLYDEMPGPESQPIFDLARKAGMVLELGYPERDGSDLYITAVIADADGTILGKYRKTHVTTGEQRYFKFGNLGFPVFETMKGKIGVQICRDRRFPEGYRCLGIGGAEIVITGYNSGFRQRAGGPKTLQEAVEHSDLCMRSAAYQNAMYVISSAKAGVEYGTPFLGASSIIDPNGTVILRALTAGDELVVTDIDLSVVKERRDSSRYFSERQTQYFGALVDSRVPATAGWR